jgi:hypothetical protein
VENQNNSLEMVALTLTDGVCERFVEIPLFSLMALMERQGHLMMSSVITGGCVKMIQQLSVVRMRIVILIWVRVMSFCQGYSDVRVSNLVHVVMMMGVVLLVINVCMILFQRLPIPIAQNSASLKNVAMGTLIKESNVMMVIALIQMHALIIVWIHRVVMVLFPQALVKSVRMATPQMEMDVLLSANGNSVEMASYTLHLESNVIEAVSVMGGRWMEHFGLIEGMQCAVSRRVALPVHSQEMAVAVSITVFHHLKMGVSENSVVTRSFKLQGVMADLEQGMMRRVIMGGFVRIMRKKAVERTVIVMNS